MISAAFSLAWAFIYQALADGFRPLFHFVIYMNWVNQSNGLIKISSTWHLFYQHNPIEADFLGQGRAIRFSRGRSRSILIRRAGILTHFDKVLDSSK
jgi:hypothetical protein